MSRSRSTWQFPRGVYPGAWDYFESERVATEYDSYFASHSMFQLDARVIERYLPAQENLGRTVVDLGCGTGRALLPLIARGWHGVAVDLSQSMLKEVVAKADAAGIDRSRIQFLRANLVDLGCIGDHTFDSAICLFSTFGMIRGSDERRQAFAHAGRILRPGGVLILQVHNYWAHLLDPEGPWWMLRNFVRSIVARDVEIGDKVFAYRGVPSMYLHSFTRSSLRQLLSQAQMEEVETIPLTRGEPGPLRHRWLLGGVRASGWIVVARKRSSITALSTG